MNSPEALLQQHRGYDSFRPHQNPYSCGFKWKGLHRCTAHWRWKIHLLSNTCTDTRRAYAGYLPFDRLNGGPNYTTTAKQY